MDAVNSSAPDGANDGLMWRTSKRSARGVVTDFAVPPSCGTADRPPAMLPANTIRPSGPHAPPPGAGASARLVAEPPLAGIS